MAGLGGTLAEAIRGWRLGRSDFEEWQRRQEEDERRRKLFEHTKKEMERREALYPYMTEAERRELEAQAAQANLARQQAEAIVNYPGYSTAYGQSAYWDLWRRTPYGARSWMLGVDLSPEVRERVSQIERESLLNRYSPEVINAQVEATKAMERARVPIDYIRGATGVLGGMGFPGLEETLEEAGIPITEEVREAIARYRQQASNRLEAENRRIRAVIEMSDLLKEMEEMKRTNPPPGVSESEWTRRYLELEARLAALQAIVSGST